MRVLALEPYYGGSHRSFLDGWQAHSRHEWTVLGLPAYKWKWRMRHSAVTLAKQTRDLKSDGQVYDLLLCSDMLNLAEFKGLAPEPLQSLPAIAYFHENQLTYPVRREEERDLHFAMINFTTALAAEQVWFNSTFHRDSFFAALRLLLNRMPDYNLIERLDELPARTFVFPQGIYAPPSPGPRRSGPPRLLWVARWEHDKNPGLFFDALQHLLDDGLDFRLNVLGEQFNDVPEVFETARVRFNDKIDRWGYQAERAGYVRALAEADIVVSTADHEFFGVGMVEAVAAGAFPLLPERLAYPEIFGKERDLFYDGSLDNLVERLQELLTRTAQGHLWDGRPDRLIGVVKKYFWQNLAPQLDDAVESAAR